MRRLLVVLTLLFSAASARADNLDNAVANDLVLTRVLNQLDQPTGARFLPDGRLVIIQQRGAILVYTGALPLIDAGTFPADQNGSERGLLGLAVDPEFATTNRLYFFYSEQGAPGSNRHRVAWATIDPVTNEVDVANRTVIVQNLYGPANHNGGGIEFGPDDYLYIGVGDTGCNCGCSPGTNTNNFFPTCLTNANGKILRVDRDGNIPPSNPLVGMAQVTACGSVVSCFDQNGQQQVADPMVTGAPREEIYNWGFRNPWRFSFDSSTGFMWIGDVGEVTYEEITISTQAGEHHGWPYREGAHGLATTTCNMITPNSIGDCKEPAYEYQHNGAASVTGGVFSNHCSWPVGWIGRYWFGDYNIGRIWTLEPNAARDGITGGRTNIISQVTGVVHFFEGNDGALYYVTIDDGEIWRVEPANPVVCNPPNDAGGFPDAPDPMDTGMVDPPDSGVVDPEDTGVVDPEDTGVVGFPDAAQGDGLVGDEAGVPPVEAGVGGPGNNNSKSSCSCDATGDTRAGSAWWMLLVSGLVVGRVLGARRSRARSVDRGSN